MKPLTKLLIGLGLILTVAVFGYGWHLKTVYEGFISSTESGETLYAVDVLEDYGRQITEELNSKNVQVAILSRAGQLREDLPEGVAYTHSAFFVRQADGEYSVFNLYHGEDNRLRSYLKTDKPSDFLRLLREADTGIIIPNAATQAQMKDFIGSPSYTAMHTKDYSLISNPFDLRWQNCNEFMLYALGGMLWNTTSKKEVETKLMTFLKPTPLKVSVIKRYYGPKIDERLILADHNKVVQTTTYSDFVELLEHEGRLKESYRLEFK